MGPERERPPGLDKLRTGRGSSRLEWLPPNSGRDWGAESKIPVPVKVWAFEGVSSTKWCIGYGEYV